MNLPVCERIISPKSAPVILDFVGKLAARSAKLSAVFIVTDWSITKLILLALWRRVSTPRASSTSVTSTANCHLQQAAGNCSQSATSDKFNGVRAVRDHPQEFYVWHCWTGSWWVVWAKDLLKCLLLTRLHHSIDPSCLLIRIKQRILVCLHFSLLNGHWRVNLSL